MNNKNNTTIRENFGKEVKAARIAKKSIEPQWSQTRLGMHLNKKLKLNLSTATCQKLISNIENGKVNSNITKEVVSEIASFFNLSKDISNPMKSIVDNNTHEGNSKNVGVLIHENNNLLIKTDNPIFNQYIGEYCCLFYSTDSSDPKTVDAKLNLSPKQVNGIDICFAQLTIINKGKQIKSYEGQFFINTHYNTWYCILIGKEKQEVCTLISSHINANIKNNLLNIALVLTTSAGSNKRPTMHRMIISRDRFTTEKKSMIVSQLKLNSDVISISEKNLTLLKEYAEEKINCLKNKKAISRYKSLINCVDYILNHADKQLYYSFPESLVYDNEALFPKGENRAFVISSLRKDDVNRYNNKTSGTVQEICIDIMYGK